MRLSGKNQEHREYLKNLGEYSHMLLAVQDWNLLPCLTIHPDIGKGRPSKC